LASELDLEAGHVPVRCKPLQRAEDPYAVDAPRLPQAADTGAWEMAEYFEMF